MKHKSVKICVVLDAILLVGLFLTYGPISYFRNLLVTTAMETSTHKYLARIFYNESMILDVLGKNYIEKFDEGTDEDKIVVKENNYNVTYSSKYEEQVLKKDNGNDIYKVFEVEGKNYKGHIIAVYDPKRVTLVESRFMRLGGQKLDSIIKDYDALAGINASGFSIYNNALTPMGAVIIDGEIKTKNNEPGDCLVGFNEEGILVLTYEGAEEAVKKGMKYGMEFGPFLVVNGEKANFVGNSGGLAPRTAIGQRQDGIVLLVTIDGRRVGHSLGINMNDLADLFIKYGAYNAANLDGGGSSSMVVEDEMIKTPGGYGYVGSRYIPNAWIVN